MIIVKADILDIDDILNIINQAKAYLKSQNIDQWQEPNYPNKEVFLNDIKNNNLYVLKDDDKVVGVFALASHDLNYNDISDGSWHSEKDYVAIHRIAIDNAYKGKGLTKMIFDYVKEKYCYIRIDTHKDNVSMKKCLAKNGFEYCGVIVLKRDGSQRIAYDYINDKK